MHLDVQGLPESTTCIYREANHQTKSPDGIFAQSYVTHLQDIAMQYTHNTL